LADARAVIVFSTKIAKNLVYLLISPNASCNFGRRRIQGERFNDV